MQQITDFSQSVDNNKIIVNSEKSVLKNSHIVFNGSNNILVVDDGVEIVIPKSKSTATIPFAISGRKKRRYMPISP